MTFEKELKAAQLACEKAGKLLLNHNKELNITNKGYGDIATQADTDAEKAIIQILESHFPDYGILAEESGEKKSKGKKWIIDPLDGTQNFARGSPIFGTTVALEDSGKIVLAVIHLPKIGERLYAIKGKGAFSNGKRIHVSARHDDKSSILFGGMRQINKSEKTKQMFLVLNRKYPHCFRVMGCATYNAASVAIGRAEALVSPGSKPWDLAAGCLIVQEADGIVSDSSGNPADIYKADFVLSNKLIHKDIINCINEKK
ncbi:MAG: inositol monophosphatase [Candidatus Aenigmarchaeota archaeon]|nr:inositol monophosphatase [Candidatus Aenigmarchaeota archaeon]